MPSSQHRPHFQGDIFDDVPFIKAKSAGNAEKDPNLNVDRRMVALLGYPCDIYDHGRLVKVQSVAPVVSAEKAGIPQNWDGAFTLAPLPDLLGDGVRYAVDLRVASNIDVSYLRVERRVRSLTENGWAIFRQRMVLCATRALIPLPPLHTIGAPTWAEMTLWQEWNEAGLNPDEFQPWLDVHDHHLGGFTRRTALERIMVDQVREIMVATTG